MRSREKRACSKQAVSFRLAVQTRVGILDSEFSKKQESEEFCFHLFRLRTYRNFWTGGDEIRQIAPEFSQSTSLKFTNQKLIYFIIEEKWRKMSQNVRRSEHELQNVLWCRFLFPNMSK